MLAAELRLNPQCNLAPPLLWRMVVDRIREYRYQQADLVLLFDDADRATPEALVQLARLARHDLSPESRFTMVLSGRPRRIGRLGTELLDLAQLRIDLEPWELIDLEVYLKTALVRAGRDDSMFTEEAIARIHFLTQGIPRRVNQLAELALLAADGHDLKSIDADMIDSVCRELGTMIAAAR